MSAAAARDIAAAKLNLALHVRGRLPDGRHDIETIFAFCIDGDRLSATAADELSLKSPGPSPASSAIRRQPGAEGRSRACGKRQACSAGAAITLDKKLPVASGLGGGSADAAAALRLLTSLWRIDPAHAAGSRAQAWQRRARLPAEPARAGRGRGRRADPDRLAGTPGTPVLLVNPRVPLSTAEVFGAGTASTSVRSSTGGKGGTTSRRRPRRLCLRSKPCLRGSAPARRDLHADVRDRARPASRCLTASSPATRRPTPCRANGGAWRPACAKALA